MSKPGRPPDRQEGTRRITLVAVMVGFVALVSMACSPRTTERPASEPTSDDPLAVVDGSIAYGDQSGIWAVDVANPGSPGDRVLLDPHEGDPMAWSEDGSKLLLVRLDRSSSSGPGVNSRLIVLNSDGTETVLTSPSWVAGGSFMPDGSKVVYAADRLDPEGRLLSSGIYVVDAEGGPPQLLFAPGRRQVSDEGSFPTSVYYPTLSPDGSRIAYFDGMGDWGHSVWVMNADGSDRHVVVDNEVTSEGHAFGLVWSPDGDHLAFNLRRDGGGIYTVRPDGSGLTLMATQEGNFPEAMWPQWSPDGSRIAFVRNRTLVTIGVDGGDERIVEHSYPIRTPIAWNPAG